MPGFGMVDAEARLIASKLEQVSRPKAGLDSINRTMTFARIDAYVVGDAMHYEGGSLHMPAKSGKVVRKRRSTRKPGPVSKARTSSRSKAQPKNQGTKTVKTASLSFRPRIPADDPYILNLTEGELGQVHSESFGEPFPREQFLGYLQSGAPTVIVERGGKPIGYYSYLVAPDGKMHVSALVIDPSHQSDGIGTHVMQHLEEDAKKQRVHTLEVFVQQNNKRSLAFTKKLGFTEVYQLPPNSICFQKVIAGTNGTSVAVGRFPTDDLQAW